MTLFHIFQIISCLGFGVFGGFRFGWIGALVGLPAGFVIGGLPFALTVWAIKRKIKGSSDETLLERLKSDFTASHWIIATLIVRGHAPETFKAEIFEQLRSEWPLRRQFGLLNLKLWLPELAVQLGEYDHTVLSPALVDRLKSMPWFKPEIV